MEAEDISAGCIPGYSCPQLMVCGPQGARKGHRTSVVPVSSLQLAPDRAITHQSLWRLHGHVLLEKIIVLIQAATVHFDASIVSSRLRCMQSDQNLQSVNLMSEAGAELSPS
jgi:hypothetical protein